jgi:Putative zinc-finger
MISHDRAQELISARMDAPLAATEHRELQRHLAACDACRDFVSQADDLARGLQVLPRLAPSPAVSRAVMEAVRADTPGWGWLRRSLQTLSSPGMAVASGLALVVVLAGTLIIALNAPGSDGNQATEPESTIAAVAIAPLPTEAPTTIPTTEPEPTATRAPLRTVAPAPTKVVARTPTVRPTATRVAIAAVAEPTVEPSIEPAMIDQPIIEPVAEDPTLAMAVEDPVDTSVEAELAQAAEPVPSDEGVSEAEPAPAIENDDTNQRRRNGSAEEPPAEPAATEAIPEEAIAALESAGTTTDVYLPPAAPLPMPPSQAFLPITPTPVSDGTPTPEPETQADAPQIADDWSDETGLTALAPEAPQGSDAAVADVTVVETDESKSREKRDRSSKDGNSHQEEQAAYSDDAMGWSLAPVDLAQSAELPQTTDTDETAVAATETVPAETATATEPAPQYDPATGLEIDPATGLLIDPTTGYLLDLVNGRIIDPRTGYVVHPMTGLLIDPATGAQLDPVTLAIVIPAGFGSDTPEYVPGSDSMRGTIEGVVDDTYDDATYQVIPPTDGPLQPVGEIEVPTESGEAVEIS